MTNAQQIAVALNATGRKAFADNNDLRVVARTVGHARMAVAAVAGPLGITQVDKFTVRIFKTTTLIEIEPYTT